MIVETEYASIVDQFPIPTGYLFTGEYSKGRLETLSIVVTVSTQYGCPMKCTFCDVPKVSFRGNATFDDLKYQLYNALSLFPDVQYTERLNLHYARMGDPIFNQAVFEFAEWAVANKRQIQRDTGLRIEVFHPVLTTSLPRKFKYLEERIMQWCEIKNDLIDEYGSYLDLLMKRCEQHAAEASAQVTTA